MISLIICSIKPELSLSLSKNIEATIGDSLYEILIHDNRETNWGLAKVYNHYANMAQGEILCFIHEDIKILTNDWGKIIEEFYLRNPNAGVIGFAGSMIKTRSISGWLCDYTHVRENLIQHYKEKESEYIFVNPNNEDFSEVITLDGLALFCKKCVWAESHFDEDTFSNFHFYDLDFSMAISKSHRNYVCNQIIIEHLSEGGFKREWYKEALIFHKKWENSLPCLIGNLSLREIDEIELKCCYREAKRDIVENFTGRSKMGILTHLFSETGSILYSMKLIKYMFK